MFLQNRSLVIAIVGLSCLSISKTILLSSSFTFTSTSTSTRSNHFQKRSTSSLFTNPPFTYQTKSIPKYHLRPYDPFKPSLQQKLQRFRNPIQQRCFSLQASSTSDNVSNGGDDDNNNKESKEKKKIKQEENKVNSKYEENEEDQNESFYEDEYFEYDDEDEDEDEDYYEYDEDEEYEYIEWDDEYVSVDIKESEYAPFRNLGDDDLLQFLNLPDNEVPDEDESLEALLSSKRANFSMSDDDDFSILDDPDPEELMALEEELWMLDDEMQNESDDEYKNIRRSNDSSTGSTLLERALLEGVVPAGAGVGSGCLPGDYGFDPFNFATKDYFNSVQKFLLSFLPARGEDDVYDHTAMEKEQDSYPRPAALILRDYREAEIRHGRLAMLAAIIWPLQEIIDKIFIPTRSADFTVIYGGITLPYLSLFMTLVILLLGYLDVYAKVIKEVDTGEAFLPGECFWDPLKILDGAPDYSKRKMQERELNNGRFAMVAVALYILEEAIFHKSIISLPFNQILFEPAFQIPAVQEWLDRQFQGPSTIYPTVRSVDFVDAIQNAIDVPDGQDIMDNLPDLS